MASPLTNTTTCKAASGIKKTDLDVSYTNVQHKGFGTK